MKIGKSNIALFFVALFLFFKVVGLHAIAPHIDDDDDDDSHHCELCDITTAFSFIPLLETDAADVSQLEYFSSEQKLTTNAPNTVFDNKFLLSYRLTRPPPLFL